MIIDDHPVVIAGLRSSLASQPDIAVVAEARTLGEARHGLASTVVDVVLLDLRLPDGSGAELLSMAAGDRPQFIVLSSFESPQFVDASLRLGATGFVLKTAPMAELVDAIRRVAQGHVAFSARLLRAARANPWIPLTQRERLVIAELIEGRTNDEIAARLSLSTKTIETYVSRLLERFNSPSRTELAVRAEREGWLEVPASDD
jgi:DNA-binding NarL/FixJ family response regulator